MKLPPSVINPWYQSESAHPPINEWKTCSKIYVQSAKRKVKHNHIIFARKIQKNLNNLLIYETSLKFIFFGKNIKFSSYGTDKYFLTGRVHQTMMLDIVDNASHIPKPYQNEGKPCGELL